MGATTTLRGRPLKRGTRGEDVLGWQQLLLKAKREPKLAGFSPVIKTDGIFGMQTARATADFQRRLGLPADGIVGPNTLDKARQFGLKPVVFLPGSPPPLPLAQEVVVPIIPEALPPPPAPGPPGPMGSACDTSWKRLRAEGWSSSEALKAGLAADKAVLQSATQGSGDYVYDEYKITITAMPDKLTPEAFLLELAKDLNGTINSPDFNSINVFKNRTSGVPAVGSIVDIDIQGPDNGSVIVGEIAATYFIFQTIDSGTYGSHPENGSREFGFERSGNQITFYTRGVSRPGNFIVGWVGAGPQQQGWTALLRGIANTLVARGGKADMGSFASVKKKQSN